MSVTATPYMYNADKAEGKRLRLIRSLQSAPIRICHTPHECCLCDKDIKAGQYYADRGYGQHAHSVCVDALSGAWEPRA